jgi:hypothetical protein
MSRSIQVAGSRGRARRGLLAGVGFAACALSVAGCVSTQVGPIRPITIDDDVAYTRPVAEPDLSSFYTATPLAQAAMRNQIVTARMYIADIEYHYYEARLTREVQDEGLGATLATLGLTTASTLVGSAGTKTILSGAATAVVGADKAYNEKDLLSNAIQSLQTQMRADRKAQAAAIYAKIFVKDASGNTKGTTPITEYTLPMALSDADAYYQAGTIASALIGLSKTVATAEHNADQAKADAGPNPDAVTSAKITATPIAGQTPVIPSAMTPLPAVRKNVNVTSLTRLNPFEQTLSVADIDGFQQAVCVTPTHDLGPLGSETRTKIKAALNVSDELLTDRKAILLRRILRTGPTCGAN